jgi:predicted transcriptional regulator
VEYWEQSMEQDQLISLTADIVSAHVSNNTVALSDVPLLVQRVYEALAAAGAPAPAEAPQAKTPVVSVRASIKPDYLVCMECGRQQKTLKRHLQTAHGVSPDQYRRDFGLPDTYPMVAPKYSEQRRSLAKEIGLGRKPRNAGSGGSAQDSAPASPPAKRRRRKS